jgi:hypothetical protein
VPINVTNVFLVILDYLWARDLNGIVSAISSLSFFIGGLTKSRDPLFAKKCFGLGLGFRVRVRVWVRVTLCAKKSFEVNITPPYRPNIWQVHSLEDHRFAPVLVNQGPAAHFSGYPLCPVFITPTKCTPNFSLNACKVSIEANQEPVEQSQTVFSSMPRGSGFRFT